MEYKGFVNGTYTLQSISAECQRTINLYPQTDETGLGRNSQILVSTPGLKQFVYLGQNTPIRALFTASNGRVFAVNGNLFWELFSNGTATSRGILAVGTDVNALVSMDDNGLIIFIVDGPNGYTFEFSTNSFSTISSGGGPPPVVYAAWQPNTYYGFNGWHFCSFIGGQAFVQTCTTDGTINATVPIFSSVAGTTTAWGSAVFTAGDTQLWTMSKAFTVGQFVVGTAVFQCTQAGISSATIPFTSWSTTPGATISDGTAGWVCVGPLEFPSVLAGTFGVASEGMILESGFVQTVQIQGLSGNLTPAWNNSVGAFTIDNSEVVWLCTQADVIPSPVDPNFFGGDSVQFINGFFAFNQPGTQTFWITEIYSATVDPLGFAAVEGSPDLLVCLLADHQELWMFGTTSIEVWYDAGGANFPFSKIQGAYISHGIAAKASPVRLDNTVFWLGQDETGAGIAYRANGYSPVRISTHAMEQEIQRYPMISDATAFAYQQDGHSFYVLNFPSGNATWVYDVATGMWHQRAYMAQDGSLGRGRPNCHTSAFGKHLVGDYANGNIYEMSPAFITDAFQPIARVRTAPVIDSELQNIFHAQLQLDMQVGVGSLQTPEAVAIPNPQITLTYSNDGGLTWSNENSISMGAMGEFRKRVIWRRLGRSRQRVYRVKVTDPVQVTLYNAYLILEQGSS
jgi:hypothetical protein